MKLTVIVPALNEARAIAGCLRSIRREFDGQLLVVDGGSQDATVPLAQAEGAAVLFSIKGLAAQCNVGAEKASGDVLLFVSADCEFGEGWYEGLAETMRSPEITAGGFKLSIEGLRLISWGGNFRSRYLKFALGDQGLFVRRGAFDAVGGMCIETLIPYAKLCFDLHHEGEFRLLGLATKSSARKYRQFGVIRTVLGHWGAYRRFSAER